MGENTKTTVLMSNIKQLSKAIFSQAAKIMEPGPEGYSCHGSVMGHRYSQDKTSDETSDKKLDTPKPPQHS